MITDKASLYKYYLPPSIWLKVNPVAYTDLDGRQRPPFLIRFLRNSANGTDKRENIMQDCRTTPRTIAQE